MEFTNKNKGHGESQHDSILSSFAHRFVLPSPSDHSSITLLVLHGTGGNEEDLIPLGRELAPCSAILSPRGRVLENGMPRYFRRLSEGVFDQEDLRFRTDELANFVISASKEYKFSPESVVAVGYSNGANIAASMLLTHAKVLAGAILFRAMIPFVPNEVPLNLLGKSIFLSAGRYDQIGDSSKVLKLKEMLEKSGADVTLNWEDSDHSLTREEINKARMFLKEHYQTS
jgi:phospholipase/carboxylesterase